MRRQGSHVLLPIILTSLLFLFFSCSSCSSKILPSRTAGEVTNASSAASAASEFKVGVILDLETAVGKMSRLCLDMAVSDFYEAHPGYATRLLLRTRDSKRDAIAAASAAVDLLKSERVQAIIGPQTSGEAELVAELGTKARVPIVSFSATSPTLSPEKTAFFVRTAPNDSSQARPIAALVTAFGWTHVVPVYEDSEYGAGAMPSLVDAIKAVGARVPYRCVLPVSATDDLIERELCRLRAMEGRVFLVHTTRGLASRLFAVAERVGMMTQGFSWVISEGLTSLLGAMDASVVRRSMKGVLGVRPHVPNSDGLQRFRRRWQREFLKENPESDVSELSVFGLWAYDTVWALATAAERVGAGSLSSPLTEKTTNYPNDLAGLGASQTGQRLLESIRATEFEGLSGRFHLVDGQLSAPAFEVVNVNGKCRREIGYWTPGQGLVRQLNSSSEREYSASMTELAPVIWPGESTAVPRGWVEPMVGRKLRVLVPGPVEQGFHSFMKVERAPETNETVVGGYVFEVFEAALKELPYAVRFEYFTLQSNGMSGGDYNHLVRLVHEQKYDALVGDVTITANRSKLLDFTLPYTASGLSMVVPYRDDLAHKAWIFLKPLTANLWMVSGAFLVFTGAVVWLLEHRVNPDFRGPPSHQSGTVFYFIFSTLVFSHKEKMVSNLSRMVVIIWLFVVFILQSSYTASLTSMLTVKHLRPTVTDVQELIATGEYVGYLQNSFTKGMLTKMGFDGKMLRPYKSPQKYQEALANGSSNGGVGAVFDEIPYLKVFLKDYCGSYTMAGRTYKAAGFGFAFPTGSPLARDLSKAILTLTDGDKMVRIERKWFGDQSNCPKNDGDLTPDSLNLASFWGLFLITGVASVVSLLAFFFSFAYQHRHLLHDSGSDVSLWRRVKAVSRQYDQKDLSSYTFRKEAKDREDATASPHTNRTATTGDAMASPYSTDRFRRGDNTASPPASGTQSPFSICNLASGGTPPPELGSPLQEVVIPAMELAGAAVEDISSTEFVHAATWTTGSSVEMTPMHVGAEGTASQP
uniref:Glutamate receptor 2.8 n=1 Tax=Anthurium amnicola TaxID=1678845 RepID=A0A1D1YUM9_9ARAE